VVTVFGSLKVCKKEGGLLWSMAMAKQLLNDGSQGLSCDHSAATGKVCKKEGRVSWVHDMTIASASSLVVDDIWLISGGCSHYLSLSVAIYQEEPKVTVDDSQQLWLVMGAPTSLTMPAGQQHGLWYDVSCNLAAVAATTCPLSVTKWQEEPTVTVDDS
jgi:hypothetical protein